MENVKKKANPFLGLAFSLFTGRPRLERGLPVCF